MTGRSIVAAGGYLPNLRLPRSVAAKAMASSGLPCPRTGARTVANWDEDALTLAVEAARLTRTGGAIDSVVFASTSAYFTDRAQSGILVDALALPRDIATEDVAGSRRCAVSALRKALLGSEKTLVASGEKRATNNGQIENISFGDGGGACVVGDGGGARFLGAATTTHDLVDFYTSRDRPTPYAYEARFIRDISVDEILAPTITAAMKSAELSPSDITHAIAPEPTAGAYKALAKRLGLTAPNIAAEVALTAGDLGAAHPLYAFALACARGAPGDVILLTGFGSGCDALLFQLDGPVAGAAETALEHKKGHIFTDYMRFLRLADCIETDFGMRSEVVQKAQATVLERSGREITGFIAGRDSSGAVQFPKSRIPVNPELSAPEPLEDVRLAEEVGRVVSATADRLIYTPDPPLEFGLVQFENGARVMMEFADTAPNSLAIDDPVRMRFRIKSQDKQRGFRTYFWKAAPLNRADLEEL